MEGHYITHKQLNFPFFFQSKIIRVLNLWLKNNVFAPDVINPLFDLCNPNRTSADLNGSSASMDLSSPPMMMMDDMDTNHSGTSNNNNDTGTAVKLASNQLDSNTIRQLQQLQQILMRQTGGPAEGGASSNVMGGGGNHSSDAVKFNKKLLDYDYGDDEGGAGTGGGGQHEDNNDLGGGKGSHMYGGPSSSSAVSSVLDSNNISQLLQDPNVLRQLQTLQKLNNQNEMEEKQTKLVEMRLQEEAFEKHLAKVLTKLPFANECDLSRGQHVDLATFAAGGGLGAATSAAAAAAMQSALLNSAAGDNAVNDPEVEFIGATNNKMEIINLDANDSRSPTPDRDRYKRRRNSRSRSRDRGGRGNRRRGSRSRTRSPRRRRNSSRERGGRSDRDRERERERNSRNEKAAAEKEREAYERERRRKGLPDIRKEHLSVCSTTLWVGHLSKLVQQEELSDTFGKFGDIVSIDMIVPRGCAFIAMNRRQDAYRAMADLKHHKMQGRVITISWATGKGVKSKEWKDYWEVDLGVSYIPWMKLSRGTDYVSLEEGGMFDEDSMPDWLKAHVKQPQGGRVDGSGLDVNAVAAAAAHLFDASLPPPTAGLLPPGMPMPPFGLPPARLLPPPMGIPMGLSLGVPPPPMMIPMGQGSAGQPDFMQMFQMNAGLGAGGLKPPPLMVPPGGNSHSNNGEDHMDIENDEEEEQAAAAVAAAGDQLIALQNFFNRPPPLMGGPPPGAGLLGPGGGSLLASIGADLMGGGGVARGRNDDRGRQGAGRGRDNDNDGGFDGGDRGRWSSNGRLDAGPGGRDFDRGGRGNREHFNNGGGAMFNDRRDNGGESFDRSREGELNECQMRKNTLVIVAPY